jgi:hypothetical protein
VDNAPNMRSLPLEKVISLDPENLLKLHFLLQSSDSKNFLITGVP